MASLQLQEKKLNSGHSVYINFNVSPTNNWQCRTLGTTQSYNWADLQTRGQFTHVQGGRGLLIEKALEYANNENLDINYIDLQLPDESTTSIATGGLSIGMDNNPNANATASFYKCIQINPDSTVGHTKQTNTTINIGS